MAKMKGNPFAKGKETVKEEMKEMKGMKGKKMPMRKGKK